MGQDLALEPWWAWSEQQQPQGGSRDQNYREEADALNLKPAVPVWVGAVVKRAGPPMAARGALEGAALLQVASRHRLGRLRVPT